MRIKGTRSSIISRLYSWPWRANIILHSIFIKVPLQGFRRKRYAILSAYDVKRFNVGWHPVIFIFDQVAALAAGQLTITDLVGVPESAEGEAEEGQEEDEEQEGVKEISLVEQETGKDPKSVKLRDDMEEDDECEEGEGCNEANKERGKEEATKPVIGRRVVAQKRGKEGENEEDEEEEEESSSDSDSLEAPRRK